MKNKYIFRSEEKEVGVYEVTAHTRDEALQKFLFGDVVVYGDVAYRGKQTKRLRLSSEEEMKTDMTRSRFKNLPQENHLYFIRTIEVSPVYWEVEAESEEEAKKLIKSGNIPSHHGFTYELVKFSHATQEEHLAELNWTGEYCRQLIEEEGKEVIDHGGGHIDIVKKEKPHGKKKKID